MKQRNFRMIESNGISLQVVVEGEGPLLVLLHGFPQCWYLWRNQIDELVAAGYQVAVPDQRGYGGSDKPTEVEAYDVVQCAADAAGIADALGHESFTLVTHDWGAVVGWYMALLYPERVNAVFALSVPPLRLPPGLVTRQENFGDNFFYSVYFQQPGLAEDELDVDIRKSLRVMQYAVSGDAPEGAPPDAVWDVITDQDAMAKWIGFDPVTVRQEGWTQRHGASSERVMQGPPGVGQVVEQVIAVNPRKSLRYRIIEGTPLTSHQGEITLKQSGEHTELHWSIRFRPKLAGTGALLQHLLQRRLRSMLERHLKPHIQRELVDPHVLATR